MQKKLLSLIILIGSSLICSDSNTDTNANKNVVITVNGTEMSINIEEFAKPVGSLSVLIEDLDKKMLDMAVKQKKEQFLVLERLMLERDIADYETASTKDFEDALVKEFSRETDAIKKKHDEKINANKKEADEAKNKIWDGSCWSGPTNESDGGRRQMLRDRVQQKKNAIALEYSKLVTENRDTLLGMQADELKRCQMLMSMYIATVKECDGRCGGNKDRFIACLSQKNNEAHWKGKNIIEDDFVGRSMHDAYQVARAFAKSKGIDISVEDMENSAAKNGQTAGTVKSLNALKKEENEIRNKIFNPQPKAEPEIDLTGNDKPKPEIFEDQDDITGNQNRQSDRSQ